MQTAPSWFNMAISNATNTLIQSQERVLDFFGRQRLIKVIYSYTIPCGHTLDTKMCASFM
jgi:hypothetical protein